MEGYLGQNAEVMWGDLRWQPRMRIVARSASFHWDYGHRFVGFDTSNFYISFVFPFKPFFAILSCF